MVQACENERADNNCADLHERETPESSGVYAIQIDGLGYTWACRNTPAVVCFVAR